MNCDKNDLLLYAVTDRHWLDGRRLIDVVRESLDGGVTMVQLREKTLEEGKFLEEAKELQTLCRERGVPFLVNDNVEIAREIDKDPKLLVAVQPTRGLDVGAIEYIHRQIVAERDKGKAVLLVSLELDEVMNLSDRILVMYEGEIVGEFDPKTTTVQELGLYMAGARKQGKESK